MPSTPAPATTSSCPTPGCGKPIRARGFCVACYYRMLRQGVFKSGSQTAKFRHRLSNVDTEAKRATCAVCGPTVIYPRSGENRWRCGSEASSRSRDYKRAYRASKAAMLGPKCEICGRTKKLCWDHDHKTGEFRGTLCSNCNVLVGMAQDDPTCLAAAIDYLTKRRAESA